MRSLSNVRHSPASKAYCNVNHSSSSSSSSSFVAWPTASRDHACTSTSITTNAVVIAKLYSVDTDRPTNRQTRYIDTLLNEAEHFFATLLSPTPSFSPLFIQIDRSLPLLSKTSLLLTHFFFHETKVLLTF